MLNYIDVLQQSIIRIVAICIEILHCTPPDAKVGKAFLKPTHWLWQYPPLNKIHHERKSFQNEASEPHLTSYFDAQPSHYQHIQHIPMIFPWSSHSTPVDFPLKNTDSFTPGHPGFTKSILGNIKRGCALSSDAPWTMAPFGWFFFSWCLYHGQNHG